MNGARGFVLAPPNLHRIESPHALKIPARRAEYSLTENVASPIQAEPRQGAVYGYSESRSVRTRNSHQEKRRFPHMARARLHSLIPGPRPETKPIVLTLLLVVLL